MRVAVEGGGIGRARIGAGEVIVRQAARLFSVDDRIGGKVEPQRGTGQRQIGPRRQCHRSSRQRNALITQPQQQRESEAAAGGIAHHRQPMGVGPVVEQPAIGSDRVVKRRWEWVLGSEAIVDCEHAGSRRRRDPPREVAVERRRADDVATAVENQDVAVPLRSGSGYALGRDPTSIHGERVG